ncbi:MAG: bifunctional phosphopantothenoylcysteine decarboxylase/phosphopantothenate--cysteine ligase CoaBC [Oscillospiraceae bacterium]|jgi:phosphopantothenoylcysteine decarboxylase/phosphopantothenate--cysteine ligase|nr:bifunctional phosphopantothenoylcysteine decarboxylase/phosphopantothenate--cysteine ligase CoaBC [Oscillospiraceae bacterium]
MLSERTVVMGVTGGIAAYKSAEIVRALREYGIAVNVIMTRNACEFVTPLTFETVSANPVVADMFAAPANWEVEHISLAKKADLFLIAPATANVIAKLANGIADDMLTSTALATRARILIAPAMNTGMWENPATVRNVQTLKDRGVYFVGPETGRLANGDTGVGRMSDPQSVALTARMMLTDKRDLEGKRVLVTAGPTREQLDPVRYLTNRSSGRMGYAIAERAVARGASVTLITGPVSIAAPPMVAIVPVETTMQLFQAMIQRVPNQDAVIQAAAPCDFRPAEQSNHKIKKRDGQPIALELLENPDVAAAAGARKQSGQIFVTFAAETENIIENGREKMTRKNADLMVANNVTQEGAGFDVDTNIVTLLTKDAAQSYPIMSKHDVADLVLDRVADLLARS